MSKFSVRAKEPQEDCTPPTARLRFANEVKALDPRDPEFTEKVPAYDQDRKSREEITAQIIDAVLVSNIKVEAALDKFELSRDHLPHIFKTITTAIERYVTRNF